MYQIQTALAKREFIGGGYLTLNQKQTSFFFYTFGLDGLKAFIIQDDKRVIEKILFGTEQMTRIDNNYNCKY